MVLRQPTRGACGSLRPFSCAVGGRGVRGRGGWRYRLEGEMARGASGRTFCVRSGAAPRPSPSSKKASCEDGRHKNAFSSSNRALYEDGRRKNWPLSSK